MTGKVNVEIEPYEFTKQALRYQVRDTCAECGYCDGSICEEVKQPLTNYAGIRFTSDGFDCALPVSIDSHSHCSYACLYCFSDNTAQHREQTRRPVGQMSLGRLERIFAGEGGEQGRVIRKALKYDRLNENGYPTAVQLGAINDPCDNIERQQGWLLGLIDLAIRYNQPVRISTKGTILSHPEYLARLEQAPHLFMVHFSIISPDDDMLKRIDRRAPLPSERLATMKALEDIGVETILRMRPMLPGLSDATKAYPYAWRTLLDMAHEAGTRKISAEVGFVPGAVPEQMKWRWNRIETITKVPLSQLYRTFGPSMACMRPAYTWTEEIMHAVHNHAQSLGWDIGVSDPVWKQLTEAGCCCGIPDTHPVFGNWEVESASNRMMQARDGRNDGLITFADCNPPWANEAPLGWLVNTGPGPKNVWKARHLMWEDKLRTNWNDLKSERGPLNYFQGAWMPHDTDENGDIVYKYVGLERKHMDPIYWTVRYPNG